MNNKPRGSIRRANVFVSADRDSFLFLKQAEVSENEIRFKFTKEEYPEIQNFSPARKYKCGIPNRFGWRARSI